MKNKTVIILLSVLAVAMYTVAVINFCTGNVLSGIGDVLMASSDALMAYALYRVGQLGRLADRTRKAVIGLLEQLTKGVPATLTIKGNKGTLELNPDEDENEAPEEELTEDEKRVKRMAQEYDELRGRYERLEAFVQSDTFKQLPENKRTLLSRQCQTMYDYMDVLTQRIRIESKEANLDVDIKEPDTDKAPDHE